MRLNSRPLDAMLKIDNGRCDVTNVHCVKRGQRESVFGRLESYKGVGEPEVLEVWGAGTNDGKKEVAVMARKNRCAA